MSTQRLGKGLRALIPQAQEAAARGDIQEVPLNLIAANPFQPREDFDQEKLQELAASIGQFGLLEPVILRADGQKYELVAGERRVRAAEMAGLTHIPAILRSFSDREMMQVALVENLQREDLNPMEEAEGYQKLMDMFELTQAEVAASVGKKRPSIANAVRLLQLGQFEQDLVRQGALSAGHAKVLLSVPGKSSRRELAEKVVAEGLSVRELERELKREREPTAKKATPAKSVELIALEDELAGYLGTKVTISYRRGRGKIAVEYYSPEELERLLEYFRGK